MNDDLFKNIKTQIEFRNPIEDSLRNTQSLIQRNQKAIQDANQRKYEYDQEVLQTLKDIKQNTVGLNEVVPLLTKNNENQEIIVELLKEAIEIAASDTKEEAESKWRKVMSKATGVTTDVETIQKLQGFANTILTLFQNTPV